ncbi:ATP-binding protein [Streptomyces sp. HUCO-GS316]|uniref:ATP-binding protein n=1 Tax=Streptomyces sp. HUCO-GS316 TaxID=2692198 RepID=UPI001368899B|nr:ATP-binding protein [Streptomyces sp. HUCO-GS316]MXM65779.1 ATP-binding protein [Streptomyces sp. HUCO-GS316]
MLAPQCRYQSAFPTVAQSVPATRRAARAVLTDCTAGIDEECLDRALVIITELVGNTVKHAARLSPCAELTLIADDRALTIAVHDGDPSLPCVPTASSPDCIGGWGLRMVQDLAAEVGGTLEAHSDPHRRGKTVRVSLPR